MNKQEYWKSSKQRSTTEYRHTHELLKQWQIENSITEKCVIHHRDDTEECRKYNEAHYERWGINETGDFIEGQYVKFMTASEHAKYHASHKSDEHRAKLSKAFSGDKNPSKRHEVRAKISANNARYWKGKTGEGTAYYGHIHSSESRAKTSETMKEHLKGLSFIYNVYKEHGGQLKWGAFRKALKTGDITFETRPISVFINGDE